MKTAMQSNTRLTGRRSKRWNVGLMMLSLPVVIWSVIFSYIPMFGVLIAFKDFKYSKGIFGSPWNGLDNFMYLFSSNDAARILRNTICYNLMFMLVGTVCAIAVALMLETVVNRRCIKLYQTFIFLPYFVSWVVVSYMTSGLFSFDGGVLNRILGIFGKQVSWYNNVKPWPVILLIANLWKSIGFNTLMYYGALLGIDAELYEAAEIDGAGKFKQIRCITIPLLRPTIIVMLILAVGNMMRADFGLFYYIPKNSGALYAVTDVIDTYIYRALKVSGDIAGSSATAFFQSVVGFVLVVTANAIVRKVDGENAMF